MTINVRIDQALDYAQRLDPRFGICMPWYTHGALDELASRDFKDKKILEYGGGCSTFWWSAAADFVYTVEAHQEWVNWIESQRGPTHFRNMKILRRWPEPEDVYAFLPLVPRNGVSEGLEPYRPDVICIDGSARTACLKLALTLPRPLTIIFDNWMQDHVYLDFDAEKMMEPYKKYGKFFIQADHTDHVGRPWQTAIWDLPAGSETP